MYDIEHFEEMLYARVTDIPLLGILPAKHR